MSNSTCWLFETESRSQMVTTISYIAYFWIWPICLAFDFTGHAICFVAFYKEFKANNVYSFQLYDAVAKAADTLSAFLLLATLFWFCGMNYPGAQWFQRSYVLMWYSAHLAIPLNDITTTVSLLTTLFMTIDRAISIGLPFRYKKINRKLWEGLTICISILIGVSFSLFMCPYFTVESDLATGLYTLSFNGAYAGGPVATGLANLRNILWIGGLVCVVLAGFLVVFLYRKNSNKVMDMTSGDKQKLEKKRKTEKTLFILTIYYSLQTTNTMTILMTHTFLGKSEWFQACAGRLFTPLRAMEIAVVNGSDFYIMLLLNKAFRGMIRKALGWDGTSVMPSGSRTGGTGRV